MICFSTFWWLQWMTRKWKSYRDPWFFQLQLHGNLLSHEHIRVMARLQEYLHQYHHQYYRIWNVLSISNYYTGLSSSALYAWVFARESAGRRSFLDTWNTLSSSSSCHWLKFVRDRRLLSSSLSESGGNLINTSSQCCFYDCPFPTLISTFCK